MRRWPPIIWPAMTFASLLILMGSTGGWRLWLLIPGAALAVVVTVVAVRLATRKDGRPRPRAVFLSMAGLALFYLLLAGAAAFAGPEYVVAALAAGLIPLAALALMLATARAKTTESDGHLHDESTQQDRDPFPGIGMDTRTPLGDTPEHSASRD